MQETGKPVINDTFDFYGDDMLKNVPEGFKLDTNETENKKKKFSEIFILPRLIEKEYKLFEKELKKKILKKKDGQMSTTDTVSKATELLMQTDFEITPLSTYKNKRLISYGFLNLYFEEGRMRPLRSYFAVNYDTVKRKFIYFDDYFKIVSATDSNAVRWMVLGEVGNPDFSWYTLDNEIVFSVDDENVYFYFDMFGVMGNPMGLVKGVKKKYLDKFIKDEYK